MTSIFDNEFRFTYTCGYATTPATMKTALLKMVKSKRLESYILKNGWVINSPQYLVTFGNPYLKFGLKKIQALKLKEW